MRIGKYELEFQHSRPPNGPWTIATLKWNKGRRERMTNDIALVHPTDTFCKETGRKLALKRVLAKAKLPKKERTLIWTAYLGRPRQRDDYPNDAGFVSVGCGHLAWLKSMATAYATERLKFDRFAYWTGFGCATAGGLLGLCISSALGYL